MQTDICTVMVTCRPTYVQLWSHADRHMYSYGHMQTDICTVMVTCRPTYVQWWSHADRHMYSYGHMQTDICTVMVTCRPTYVQLWSHADRHMYSYGHMQTDICTVMVTSRSVLLRLRNVSIKPVEKIKTHILFSVTYIRKSCRLWDNVEKTWYSRAAHRWQYGACALHGG